MRWTLLPVLLALAASQAAGEGTVSVEVQPDTVGAGQRFVLSVKAFGGRVGNAELPEVDGLTFSRTPFNRLSNIELRGSKVSSSLTLQYHGVADKAGLFEIPPIGVLIDGKMTYSEPSKLKVIQGEPPAPAPSSRQGQPVPARGPRSAKPQAEAPTWEDLVLNDIEVDKTEVFEGEPLQLTFRLWMIDWSGVRIGSPFGFRPTFPATEGFVAFPESPEEVATLPLERNGWDYQVKRWTQVIYPTAPGEHTIPPWNWESRAQARTQRGIQEEAYHLSTDPVTITVKPLPARPPNFSGAVGQFSLDASLKRDEVIQGVPTELTILIQGTGNPNAIGDVRLPKLGGVYMGDPHRESRIEPATMTVQKAFVYTLTPLEPGQVDIPPVEFCFFDPESESYQTLRTKPFRINVLKAVSDRVFDDTGLDLGGQKVRVLAEDIMPAITNPGALRQNGDSIVIPAALTVAPVLAYAVICLVMMRKRRFAKDTGFARAYRAKKKALAGLDGALRAQQAADALYHALIGYVADMFNRPEAGMTSTDVRSLFESRGLESGLTENYLKILRRCERSRYASAALSPDETSALTQGARATLEQLDSLLKNGRPS